MKQESTLAAVASRVTWEGVDGFVREQIQRVMQEVLEEEITEALGRVKSQRRRAVDPEEGSRNGHGKPRRLGLTCGTIQVRRPRVRGLAGPLESRVLPLFTRRSRAVGELLPELYLHGLSEGDFDLALRGLLGNGAPLSASSVARLKTKWHAEFEAWKSRPLSDLEVVYLWVDGIYVKAGLEKDKAAILVIVAALRDGRKVILAVKSGHRESIETWSDILRDLKRRGLRTPRLVIGDGHLGIWGGLANVYSEAQEQRCWNHRIVNVLDKIAKRDQPQARILLKAIPYAATRQEAERLKGEFQAWCRTKAQDAAGELLNQDWERMMTFYRFPREHWKHLRTTNIVESPFAMVRLRTTAAKRFKKVDNATDVLWKLLRLAETRFRKLDAPELLPEVAEGAVYLDGLRLTQPESKVPA